MGEAGRTVEGRNGGTLTPRPPGSNGDVHRGPDRYIRRNVMEGVLMRALIREGVCLVISANGKRRHRSKVPAAMVENFVVRLQQIALRGTNMEFLRLVSTVNDVFKTGKNEKNGDGGGPFPSTFIRPVPSEPPPVETPAPVSSSGSGTLIHGQEYV